MELTGRVALITGGKRIGSVVATELARGGADVALVYRASRAEAEETADAVRALGRRAVVLKADLRQPDACERVVDETVAGWAGSTCSSTWRRSTADAVRRLTLDDWDAQMAVDLRAAWLCARAAVPHMRRLRGGRIINFSDWVARSGRPRYPGYLPYYVAKAGVIALTEALALELAADQILVNAVAPGPIVAPEGTTDEEFAAVERATPLGRWGGEIEIAKAVARAGRQRLHHRRNDPRGRRTAREVGDASVRTASIYRAGRLVAAARSRRSRSFFSAGPHFTSPVCTSNCEPCHGHCTVPQISAPSESGPPRCVQRSSKAA